MKAVFFPNREVVTIQLMNLTLLVLVLVLFGLDRMSGVHMAALVATVTFALTLIPARLLGLKWLKRLEPDLLQIARNGKWLGIWTGLWFAVYVALALPTFYDAPFTPLQLLQRETVLLGVSLLIFAVLLSLSNKWSYAHVKYWKQINMLIWLIVPFAFTHLLLAGTVFGAGEGLWAPEAVLALSTVAGVSGVFRPKRDYFAWWRIWLLVLGVAICALVTWFWPAIL